MIEVSQVTKLYGKQKALDNVSFTAPKGQIVGFLGPNGAGKSTMMKIITSYISPNQGNVSVAGFNIFDNPLDAKRVIGYLPENNPLYLDMYVKEYLAFVGGIYKLKNIAKLVDTVVSQTGLTPESHKKIGALSKGYRQRVGLAQAIIHNPQVLILDEPTSGLDPNQLVDIRNLIIELGKEKTVMLSTHIMQEVEAMCNRAIIINKGKIVADDTVDTLDKYRTGANVVVVEFDKQPNKETLRRVTGVTSVENTSGNTYRLGAKKGTDLRADLFKYAVENNLAILTLAVEETSIEDIFRQLTR